MTIDPGLRRLAMRTLLAAFRGHTAPEWAIDLVQQGLAGYTLFGFNIVDTAQVTALTGQLRAARPGVLLAIDEEGGDVTRLAHRTGSPYPGNAALGAIDDLGLTRAVYSSIGSELVKTGLNLNLAPTVDVNIATDNPVIGTRSFGAQPFKVALHAAAAVAGLQEAGIAACAKHFPGLGTLAVSTDKRPYVRGHVRDADLAPYRAAIEADVPCVMIGHGVYPSLGPRRAVLEPATYKLLRGSLGFRGITITDSLSVVHGRAAAWAPAAARAGADLLLFNDPRDASRAIAALLPLARSGALDTHVARILRLKAAID